MFNQVIFAGNLCADPELRYTDKGTPVCTLRLGVNTRTVQNGQQKDEALFIDCIVFSKQAEACGQYLVEGRPVLVEGRLRQRRWEKDGKQFSKFEVLARSVRFLGGKKDDAQGETASAPYEAGTDEPF